MLRPLAVLALLAVVGALQVKEKTHLKVNDEPVPKIVNVGLVSTGTMSLHSVLGDLGLCSEHVAPEFKHLHEGDTKLSAGNLSLTHPTSLLKQVLNQADAFHDIPFPAPEIISQADRLPDNIVMIATNRSRDSWIRSMQQDPKKGSSTFKVLWKVNDDEKDWSERAHVYDQHQELLQKYNIPTISLEDSDEAKWSTLCLALSKHPADIKQKCEEKKASGAAWFESNPTDYNTELGVGSKRNVNEKYGARCN